MQSNISFFRYLLENVEWFHEQLGDDDDDYILFDCPGQIELYTHMDVFKKLVEHLKHWNFMLCSVFLVDSQFMIDGAKFISGTMSALSVMVNLELPHVNILSKIDLISKSAKKQLDRFVKYSYVSERKCYKLKLLFHWASRTPSVRHQANCYKSEGKHFVF